VLKAEKVAISVSMVDADPLTLQSSDYFAISLFKDQVQENETKQLMIIRLHWQEITNWFEI